MPGHAAGKSAGGHSALILRLAGPPEAKDPHR